MVDVVEHSAPRSEDVPVKLTEWAQEPVLQDLVADVEASRPYQQEHIRRVEEWLHNLNMTGPAKIKPVKGRSSVQPKLIRKQAEWRYGSLSEPFLSSDKMFALAPRSWEDRAACQQNELVLNWQFDEKIDKVTLIDQFVRTAVDEGAVLIETGWDRETKMEDVTVPVWEYFPMVDEAQIQALTEAGMLEVENPAEFAKLPEDVRESVRYSMEQGQPLQAVQTGTQVVQQEKVLRNQPTVTIADIRNLVIDATCGGDLDKAMFMAYSSEITRGELMRDSRYRNVDQIPKDTTILGSPDHVPQGQPEITFRDEARQKLVLHRYYGYYDIEGQGHLTPILVAWVGSTVVRMELNPFPDGKPPFVLVPFLPIKKSCYGEPDGELLVDNQKILGAVTRGTIDLMARSANAQRGMAKNMLDVTNKRRFDNGEDYEFNPGVHPANGIVEHKFPELPQSAMAMMQMQNIEAESLTGVKMFADRGMASQSLGPVAAGIRGVLDAASKREMGILRRLAKGMALVGAKVVAMNQEFLSEEEVIRLTNEEFVTVRRDELHGNFDCKVDISTAEEDEAKASRLEFMLQTMGNTGDPGVTKILLTEIARLRRMPDLAHQIKNYEPEPDPMQQRLMELKIQREEAEIAKLQAETAKAQATARKDNSIADAEDLDFVERETGTTHARELQKQERQAEANQDLEVTKAIIKQGNSKTPDGKVDDTPTREKIRQAIGYNAATRS